MWFDTKRALAKIQASPLATSATPATNLTPAQPFVAIVADVAASPAQIRQSAPMRTEPTRSAATSSYGVSIARHPLTCTERVVMLDAWRKKDKSSRHKSNFK